MADKKSLSDLGELTNPKPEVPAEPAAAEAPATEAVAEAAPSAPRREGRRDRD